MRALICNLIQTLPERRRSSLKRELGLLDHTIETLYALPEDLALALVPDSHGLGGASSGRAEG